MSIRGIGLFGYDRATRRIPSSQNKNAPIARGIMLAFWASVIVTGFFTPSARADFVFVTSRADLAGADTIDWGPLGGNGAMVPNPFNIVSIGGNSVLGSKPFENFRRLDQGNGVSGNFAFGDRLLFTDTNGPLTLDFPKPVLAAGTQIQRSVFGPFTATIEALDTNGNVLASFSVDGVSNSNQDNSAIFIGIRATNGDVFDKLRVHVPGFGDFAFLVNQVDFTVVPEPSGWVLALMGGAGMLWYARRRSYASPNNSSLENI